MAEEKYTSAQVWMRSLLYVGIVILLAPLIDYVALLLINFGGATAVTFARSNLWINDITGYLAIYLLMLFYLKTTFNPFSAYGYALKKDYVGIGILIGIVSGVIMYGIDVLVPLPNAAPVPAFTPLVGFGYLIGAVLLPAITEETLFRGVIQSFYMKATSGTMFRKDIPRAILYASLFEAGFHLFTAAYFAISGNATYADVGHAVIASLPQAGYVLVFGAIGGYFYARTRSLVVPFLIHAIGNATEYGLIWMIH